MSAWVEPVVQFFETISPESVARIPQLYAADAVFKDPFNAVQGEAHIRHIFQHMFQQVEAPRFHVLQVVEQGNDAFLVWDFEYRLKPLGQAMTIHGSSHLRFDEQGRIAYHRDYWDAAEELYEKLPLLGGLMRLLKKQVQP